MTMHYTDEHAAQRAIGLAIELLADLEPVAVTRLKDVVVVRTKCGRTVRVRVDEDADLRGEGYVDISRAVAVTVEDPIRCRQCGEPTELDRIHWATPVCYACVPPPPTALIRQETP